MADKAKIDDNEITTVTPAEADKTSNPIPNDAEGNQPPVRTNRPDVPIARTLGAGAGASEGRELTHEVDGVPTDADGFDFEGRFHAGTAKKA